MADKSSKLDQSEVAAVGLISGIEQFAFQVLAPNSRRAQTSEEREELEEAARDLRPAFNDIARTIIDPLRNESPSLLSFGFERIWILTRAAFLIGVHGAVTKSGEKFFAENQATGARQARSRKLAKEQTVLLEAVGAVAKERGLRLSSGDKFANLVLEQVAMRLVNHPDYKTEKKGIQKRPTVNAIKTAVRYGAVQKRK
jgi:hypothetical protein